MKLAEIKTMQDVLGSSFRIPYNVPMAINEPQRSRMDSVFIPYAPALVRSYYKERKVIMIRLADAAYLIPYTRDIEDIIKENGFTMKRMYVPFTHGEYPIDRKERFDIVFKEASR